MSKEGLKTRTNHIKKSLTIDHAACSTKHSQWNFYLSTKYMLHTAGRGKNKKKLNRYQKCK